MAKEIDVKPGQGIMFEGKPKNERAPNMRGAFMPDRDIKAGEKIEIAGWVKTTRNGNMMITFKESLPMQQITPSKGYNDSDGHYRKIENDVIPNMDEDVPY